MTFLFGRPRVTPLQAASARLHDALVAQIRSPVFYTDLDVPDTFESRFDLLVLHAALMLRRLRDLGPDGRALAQSLVDTMFARFEIAMRELGVSDIGVPKRMKRLAEAFKGRTTAYEDALRRQDHQGLSEAVARNVLGGAADGTRLALYASAIAFAVADAPLAAFEGLTLTFPDPVRFVSRRDD